MRNGTVWISETTDVKFTLEDTAEIQKVEMKDEVQKQDMDHQQKWRVIFWIRTLLDHVKVLWSIFLSM